jgi:hypothetical protein
MKLTGQPWSLIHSRLAFVGRSPIQELPPDNLGHWLNRRQIKIPRLSHCRTVEMRERGLLYNNRGHNYKTHHWSLTIPPRHVFCAGARETWNAGNGD